MNEKQLSMGEAGQDRARHYYLHSRHGFYRTGPAASSSYGSTPAGRIVEPKSSPITSIDEGPQTVEQLVDQGYFAVPAMVPELAILHDRSHTAWLGLDDLISEARDRVDIYRKNMLDLKWSECYAFNDLARGGWPPSPEQYEAFSSRLQDVAAEKRAERVSAWRDLSAIKQLLPEAAQNYLSAHRKNQILDDTSDDLGGDAL